MKICVIGAGVSGCAVLRHFVRLQRELQDGSTISCFEKQKDWGGMWNYDWRTSVDEFGELVHASMYRHLWVNEPKEVMEFPDYTYEDHFGRAVPSFPPRAVIADYIKGRWAREGIRPLIKFCHVVQRVEYNQDEDDFTVIVKDLRNDAELPPLRFSHVIVANGLYTVPNTPSFPGLDSFPGRVLHSHELRHFSEFEGKRILVVGGSLSAQDAAIQCFKFGSSQIVISSRSSTIVSKMSLPERIELRPLLKEVKGQEIVFEDGSTGIFDVIILCTGYVASFPFMSEELRLKTETRVLSPSSLYKMSLFLDGGNSKVFYMGITKVSTFQLYEQSALWSVNVIFGKIKLPLLAVMMQDAAKWFRIEDECASQLEKIKAKYDLMVEIQNDNESPTEDLFAIAKIFDAFLPDYLKNPLTCRDRPYASIYTGKMAPVHHTDFLKEFDDSLEAFLKNETSDPN